MKLLLIDNRDSFTWNLAQAFSSLGADCTVMRADLTSAADVRKFRPTHIVISPGPHRPEDAALSISVIEDWSESVPLLGVCLGHQCIATVFGGSRLVTHAPAPMHGKTSPVFHTGYGIFRGVPSPFTAARYHSLMVKEVPDGFVPLAWTGSKHRPDVLMAMAHRTLPLTGVQFHPESFLTEKGSRILANFLTEA